jgi:hypothetical protein
MDFDRLTPRKFQEYGFALSPIQKQQMNGRYDFYYMTLAVSMQPGPGVRFTRLTCHLDFGPKGRREPIVHSIFPQSEWREILRMGRKMDLGLDSSLRWTAAVESPDAAAMDALPAALKGKIAAKNDLNAYITVPDYSYQLGRTEIAAYGEGNSECFWRIDKPGLQMAQTVQLGVVFKVPRGASSIELRAVAAVEPAFQWLNGNLRDVFEFLSDKIKNLLTMNNEERKGKDRLPVGDHEEWPLDLPEE